MLYHLPFKSYDQCKRMDRQVDRTKTNSPDLSMWGHKKGKCWKPKCSLQPTTFSKSLFSEGRHYMLKGNKG